MTEKVTQKEVRVAVDLIQARMRFIREQAMVAFDSSSRNHERTLKLAAEYVDLYKANDVLIGYAELVKEL